ncbi:MAG: hypothetical protein ACTSYA_00725, partial [Candidatus Kariarchaeaceae archaeon]
NYNFSIKFTNDEGAFVTDSLIVKVGSVIVGEYGSEITFWSIFLGSGLFLIATQRLKRLKKRERVK